jgi:crotonobetainyl-CoA:carnitine CoA-transferase CaiB-like acyl-CoA transferase
MLDGIRVVEFAQNAAVPQCARYLASMGADVVKVEPPEGDSMRHLAKLTPTEGRAYALINPGKRSVTLDLGSDDSAPIVEALIRWADICLIGLKQDDLARYGLDWDRTSTLNPRLVQLELSAFGPEGPDAGEGGYDGLAQAQSGLGFSMNRSASGVPITTRPAFIDFASGAVTAMGVIAALRHRDLTGEGQRVDASLLGTAMSLGTPLLSSFEHDRTTLDPLAEEVEALQAAGASFDDQRAHYESRVTAASGAYALYFRNYRTSDGLVSLAGLSPGLMARFHEITGIDPPPNRDPHSDAFRAVVDAAEALFATRTTEEWISELRAGHYPCSRYNLPYQAVRDPQVRANDYIVDLHHPDFGQYSTFGFPLRFSATKAAVRGRSPKLGEHTAEVLHDIGIATTGENTEP